MTAKRILIPRAELMKALDQKEALFRQVRGRIRGWRNGKYVGNRYDPAEIEAALEWLDRKLVAVLNEATLLGLRYGMSAKQLIEEPAEGEA